MSLPQENTVIEVGQLYKWGEKVYRIIGIQEEKIKIKMVLDLPETIGLELLWPSWCIERDKIITPEELEIMKAEAL